MPQVSCLIPLYNSQPFFDVICENIDSHLDIDAEVLVSDRHGLDDTAERLASRYAGAPRVRVMTAQDRGDWVSNISDMIQSSQGQYFRIIPHDDNADAHSTMAMIRALDVNDDAILAYGIVLAIDSAGNRLPELDQLNENETSTLKAWPLESALSLYWCGRFNGAFKGVIRTLPVKSLPLSIKKTATLIASERAWLFGLALAGRFQFVPEAVLIKRYYAGSTSSGWKYTADVHADAVRVMAEYCDDLIGDSTLRTQAKLSLETNLEASQLALARGEPMKYRPIWEIHAGS